MTEKSEHDEARDAVMAFFEKNHGPYHTKVVRSVHAKMGVAVDSRHLDQLAKRGLLKKVSHGVYELPQQPAQLPLVAPEPATTEPEPASPEPSVVLAHGYVAGVNIRAAGYDGVVRVRLTSLDDQMVHFLVPGDPVPLLGRAVNLVLTEGRVPGVTT